MTFDEWASKGLIYPVCGYFTEADVKVAFQAGAASRDDEIAELVAALELLSKYIAYNGDDWVQRTALEALAKVRKS